MSFQTKAFDAQDELLDLLQASTSLTAWTIDYGLPANLTDLHIWIDESVEDWTRDGDTSGLVSQQEGFNLTVYIYDAKTGATAVEIRDEIKAAAGVVSDIIGSAPFLGNAVLYASISAAAYEGAFRDPEGRKREGVLKLTVGCAAFVGA